MANLYQILTYKFKYVKFFQSRDLEFSASRVNFSSLKTRINDMMVFKNKILMFTRSLARNHLQHRLHSTERLTKIYIPVKGNTKLVNDVEENKVHPRRHPGAFKSRHFVLPEYLVNAARIVLEDYPIAQLLKDGLPLARHIYNRQPGLEGQARYDHVVDISEKVSKKLLRLEAAESADSEVYKNAYAMQMAKLMNNTTYNWKAINYNAYVSRLYLLVRSPADYAVLMKIFTEISMRDPHFCPTSMFDFGSGVGTATWAAIQFWKNSLREYFNVDTSSFMHTLAELMLRHGMPSRQMMVKDVYYRQFLPATHHMCDLVVCAYSLLELPTADTRLETVLNLWNKTGKYLVIVEQGTKAGFDIITEARDYILNKRDQCEAHVFSPCPHEGACPRSLERDNVPCNFIVQFTTLPVANVVRNHPQLFCYVVLAKGKRSETDEQWPRFVMNEPMRRSKHVICTFCTKHQQIQKVVLSACKHGKACYYFGRMSHWGDMYPGDIGEEQLINISPSENVDNNNDSGLVEDSYDFNDNEAEFELDKFTHNSKMFNVNSVQVDKDASDSN